MAEPQILFVSNVLRPIEVTLTLEQLQEAAAWWVDVLGLGGWSIDLSLERQADVEAEARCYWTLSKRRATIRFSRPEELPTGSDPVDMERLLVHELLHVVFAAWDEYSDQPRKKGVLEDVCVEQPIDRLALLLVALRRNVEKYRFSWEKKPQKRGGRRGR